MLDRDTRIFILALVVVLGGGYSITFAPNVSPDVKLFLAGAIGTVLTFFFGKSIATESVDQTNGRLERAVTRAINASPPNATPPSAEKPGAPAPPA